MFTVVLSALCAGMLLGGCIGIALGYGWREGLAPHHCPDPHAWMDKPEFWSSEQFAVIAFLVRMRAHVEERARNAAQVHRQRRIMLDSRQISGVALVESSKVVMPSLPHGWTQQRAQRAYADLFQWFYSYFVSVP